MPQTVFRDFYTTQRRRRKRIKDGEVEEKFVNIHVHYTRSETFWKRKLAKLLPCVLKPNANKNVNVLLPTRFIYRFFFGYRLPIFSNLLTSLVYILPWSPDGRPGCQAASIFCWGSHVIVGIICLCAMAYKTVFLFGFLNAQYFSCRMCVSILQLRLFLRYIHSALSIAKSSANVYFLCTW